MSDQDRSVSRATSRRNVLRSAAVAGLGLWVPGKTVADGRLAGTGPAASSQLPTRTVAEQFETAVTPSTEEQVVFERDVVVLRRSLSHVGMKLLDEDDVARKQCVDGDGDGDQEVGVQHRFVASMTAYTVKKDLAYYYSEFARNGGLDDRDHDFSRAPQYVGLGAADQMGTAVHLNDDSSEKCGNVTFRLNHVHQGGYDLSEYVGENPQREIENYDTRREDAREDVADVVEDPETTNPNMPDTVEEMMNWVEGAVLSVPYTDAVVEFGSVGLDVLTELDHGLPDDMDDIPDELKWKRRWANRARSFKKVTGTLQTALNVYAFMERMYELKSFEQDLEWEDGNLDGVSLGASGGGYGNKDVLANFVDFTVTVPVGSEVEIEVDQQFSPGRLGLEGSSWSGAEPNLLEKMTWKIVAPGTDPDRSVDRLLDEGDGGPGLPRIERVDADPGDPLDPDVDVRRDGRTVDDAITFQPNCAVPDTDETAYRWRIYKKGGKVRPATFFEKSPTVDDRVLAREPGETRVLSSPFGPGEYRAEVMVRDAAGKTGTDAAEFRVEPDGDRRAGTQADADASRDCVPVGETVEFDAAGSVGYDGTEDAIDAYEWVLEYPDFFGGTPEDPQPKWGQRVEYSFDRPGSYKVVLRVYSLEEDLDDGQEREAVVHEAFEKTPSPGKASGDPALVDRQDFTITVLPESAEGCR